MKAYFELTIKMIVKCLFGSKLLQFAINPNYRETMGVPTNNSHIKKQFITKFDYAITNIYRNHKEERNEVKKTDEK